MRGHSIRAFTLIEIIAVIVIVGVIASLALPQYTRLIERHRAEQALMVLRALHSRAQMLYAKYNTCLDPNRPAGVVPDRIEGLNRELGLNLTEDLGKYFLFAYHANCFDQTAPFAGDLAHASRRNKDNSAFGYDSNERYVLVLYPEPLSNKNPGCDPDHGSEPCPVPERMCQSKSCGE
jgi:prepilin-type N-terminal cleavage/methylation domain-containing protein